MNPPIFSDLMSPPIRSIDKWDDFAEAVEKVFSLNIDDPRKQIEEIRFLLPTQDNEELKKTAVLLGFHLTGDVLELSTSNMSKLVTQLALYYNLNGTELFIKFIDLVLNADTKVDVLYTEDYLHFYKVPQGTLLINGGTWYETTHIELSIALLSSYPVLLYGQTLVSRIRRLFYQNCPINLVIEKFWFVLNLYSTVGIGTIGSTTTLANNVKLDFGYHVLEINKPI